MLAFAHLAVTKEIDCRRRAVVMSQAPGLSGTPDSGHCSSAVTSASCASSSATPTSRTIRVSPAMSRADSIRQTASMARWVSEAVTAADQTTFDGLGAMIRLAQFGCAQAPPAPPRSG
jgi:hypothetical protein